MNQTVWVMIGAILTTGILIVTGLGISLVSAQSADNATTTMTIGNTTGDNMTSGTTAEETGGIASSEKCVDISECQATPSSPSP